MRALRLAAIYFSGMSDVRMLLDGMTPDQAYFTPLPFQRLKPGRCPTYRSGISDNRNVISGIVHVLKSSYRCAICHPSTALRSRFYNRFVC
jgi:hypothetical protein